MPEKSLPRKPSRRGYIVLGLLVAVVIGAWTTYWAVARGAIVDVLANSRKTASASGGEFACSNQSVGGFPFRFELTCAPLQAGDAAGARLTLAGLRAVVLAYNPRHLIFEADAPLEVSPGRAGGSLSMPALSAGWETARASVRLQEDALGRADAIFEAPKLVLTAGSAAPFSMVSQSGEIHIRRASDTASGVDVALSLSQIRAGSEIAPLDAKLVLHLPYAASLLAGRPSEPLAALLRAPGGIGITDLRLKSGETTLAGGGSLGLDDDGLLNGTLELKVAGVDKLSEVLRPVFPPGSNIPQSLQGALQGFGAKSEIDGEETAEVTVTFDRSTARVGLIPLGKVPPAF
ncbi:DUF2125 domain-containing protein [Rhizobiales bacterium]|uniref:DUF2125 domain-containing protein n=1 Tax=Hongsoonwoonella zoysiae TaxID=2821844 RepID=UPI0015600187|nr:DUF2125 domain-containing protein [Hongsoonwoonella zoysiae]NRG16875.1 DUF2125 domain-containing protein [Hongsoonwoonella zoysiae]